MMNQPSSSSNSDCPLSPSGIRGTSHPGLPRNNNGVEVVRSSALLLFDQRVKAFDAVQSEKRRLFGEQVSSDISQEIDKYSARIYELSNESGVPYKRGSSELSEVLEVMPPRFVALLTRFSHELSMRVEGEKIVLAALETVCIEQAAEQDAWNQIEKKVKLNESIKNAIELEAQKLMSLNHIAREFEGRKAHPRLEF